MRFPYNQLSIFNIRFVLDSYHIVLFLLHGMFYSDVFLIKNFERYFTTKFLDYTQSPHPLFKKEEKKNLSS